ncbi:MAG TPA: 30S ribosomal protein S14 [Alphaproteobacteria bacterium]
MAKVGSINKMNKVAKLVKKFAAKRAALKEQQQQARKGELDFDALMALQEKFNVLPRYSAKVRLHNRCTYDGRPRGFMRKFAMNRVLFRKLASEGKIPGVVKSSW